jgi:hypothetical protein
VGRGSSGSPREVAAACFHAARRTSLHSAVRQTFDRLVSSLHVRVASSEHLRAQLCPFLSEQAGLPGFLPSSRPHQRASTDREASQASLRAVHRRSQPLDGFLRALAPGLVSSPSRVQGSSRSGASLSTQRPSLRQRGLPSSPLSRRSSTILAGSAAAPKRASASRLRSAWRRVRTATVISRRHGRSPPRVPAPPGAPPLGPEPGYPDSPAHDVLEHRLRLRDRSARASSAS